MLRAPFQSLDANAISFGRKCVADCVKGGSPLGILTPDGRLYFPISAKMPDADQPAGTHAIRRQIRAGERVCV